MAQCEWKTCVNRNTIAWWWKGKGTAGFLKGSGDLDLIEAGETTVIKYTGEMQVGE